MLDQDRTAQPERLSANQITSIPGALSRFGVVLLLSIILDQFLPWKADWVLIVGTLFGGILMFLVIKLHERRQQRTTDRK